MIPVHLTTLIQAVKQVSPYLVTNCEFNDGHQIQYMEERTFSYELYRQWQNLIEVGYDKLVINAEITKKCVSEDEFLSRLIQIFGLTNEHKPHRCFYPDLVCHHSQFTSDTPEVICEIKTKKGISGKDKTKTLQDFKKLSAYMTEGVLLHNPFKIGVFILIGGNFSDIKSRIDMDELIRGKQDEIYCLIYNVRMNGNEFTPDVQCMSLHDVIMKKYEHNN